MNVKTYHAIFKFINPLLIKKLDTYTEFRGLEVLSTCCVAVSIS